MYNQSDKLASKLEDGLKGDSNDSYVKMELAVENGQVRFVIRNNIGQVDDVEDGKYGGIGLENVKRRLELIYNGNYQFGISSDENEFKVKLVLK